VVDLDGARAGAPQNLDTVRQIVEAIGMEVQVGGGIRTTGAAGTILQMGAGRVIVGTRALREPAWLGELAGEFPGRIALGLDARGGCVAVEGWESQTARTAADVLASVRGLALAAIIYTDIARDGMMAGPNIEATAEVVSATRFPVIASGGVTTVDDVKRLKAAGVAGAIIGRALYEGRITLEAALAAAGE
jgi:phosphoribosylformimino-5-aminoimidazole carboxamide ribotide isomerase